MSENHPQPKQKYHDYPVGVQRASIVRAHSEGSEEKTIFRPLTDDELQMLDKQLSETAVILRNHDEVLQSAKTQHKKDTVDLRETYEYTLKKIRAKGEEKVMEVHKYFNHDEMTVEYYDNDGVFVESRAMLPSEKNAIFGSTRTEPIVRDLNGTNG
jgi:hypothetical protein